MVVAKGIFMSICFLSTKIGIIHPTAARFRT